MNSKKEKQNEKIVGVDVLGDPNIVGKTQKGITLIALVITIIVLLILAGVTISMVLGDDGIIAQAQGAKEAQEEGEKKDNEAIQKGEGNIDIYTEGTVANTVKVGDYVEYNYNVAECDTADIADIGTGSQKFNSNEEEKEFKTTWRVLSKKDGIVKLISEVPRTNAIFLTLTGAKGWVNGPKVLNEICKRLYSSNIGTARSINIEDVNEVTGYKADILDKAVYRADKEYIPVKYGTTIKEAAKIAGSGGNAYNMANFANNTPEEGKKIGDYELTAYEYTGENQMGTRTTEEYEMLFPSAKLYWLASSFVSANYNENYADFGIMSATAGMVSAQSWLFCSDNYSETVKKEICPIVTLKTGLEIDTSDTTRDGSTAEKAWKIKGN